jgi:predicted DNA-binding transcriptional regulator
LSKVRAPRQISEMTDERIRIWSFLVLSLGKERWVTHEQIALGAQVAMRTARDNALTLFQHGILDRVERTPHRYRISPQAKKQGLYQRLQQAKEMSDEEAGEGAP